MENIENTTILDENSIPAEVNDENVVFIEWSNCLASQQLINNHLAINIKYISKNQRMFEITANGNRYESLLKELENND